MALALAQLVDPAVTAVVTSAVQNGVFGTSSALPALPAEARRAMLPSLERLLPGARAAGVQVVHATASRRAACKGANTNARLFLGVRQRSDEHPSELQPLIRISYAVYF